MKKYKYVRLKNEKIFEVGFSKHREIIDSYAEKGYRYTGFIPLSYDAYGRITAMDLIFETNAGEDDDENN